MKKTTRSAPAVVPLNRFGVDDRLSRLLEHHQVAVAAAIVVLVFVASMILTVQGWRSRVPAFDLLTYAYGAHDLLEKGVLPQHGDTGSYWSIKPPGTAWLMVPGMLFSNDVRISNYVGTGILHAITLVALFFLGRRHFGTLVASAAVMLYGLSGTGTFLAGSLWPNGRPDAFVLTVALAGEWVIRRDGRFLAAALAALGLGMYIDMAIAPTLGLFPVLWLYYRPPVRLIPLTVVAAVLVLAWSPYLRFEAPRGFADIRSQVFQQLIAVADYKSAWCDPRRDLATWPVSDAVQPAPVAADEPAVGGLGAIGAVAGEMKDKAFSNLDLATQLPGGTLFLATVLLAALTISSVAGKTDEPQANNWRRLSSRATMVGGVALLLTGVATHVGIGSLLESSGASVSIAHKVGLLLALAGLAALVLPPLVDLLDRYLGRRGVHVQTREQVETRRVLILSLLVPWFVLLVVAEPAKPERFWWLWPLQVLLVAAFVFGYLPRLMPAAVAWLAAVVVAGLILINPGTVGRAESWRLSGYAGVDAEEVQVVDFLAQRVRAQRHLDPSIGYEILIYPFMASYHVTNPIYKVGAEYDMMLKYMHGVENTDVCAEGIAGADDYRVVQVKRKPAVAERSNYFPVERGSEFSLVGSFGYYEVWERKASSTATDDHGVDAPAP